MPEVLRGEQGEGEVAVLTNDDFEPSMASAAKLDIMTNRATREYYRARRAGLGDLGALACAESSQRYAMAAHPNWQRTLDRPRRSVGSGFAFRARPAPKVK